MSISRILGTKGFWQVNKPIAKALKCNDASLLLSELVDKCEYYKDRDKLCNDFFYATTEDIEESINLSYHQQKHAIAVLENVGFIETKLTGIPAKQHFKILDNKIWSFLNTGILEFQELDVENFKIRKKKEKEQKGIKKERHVQPSPSILLPDKIGSDGTNIHSEPLIVENNSKSEIGGESSNLQPSSTPQPPDVEKIGNEMFNLLRKRVPKSEMSEILDSIDIDLPTLSKMFTEYWLYQKGEKFNSSNWKGLVSSFNKWISIAKTKEIPAKETTSGIKAKPIMEKVLYEVGKKKRMTLSPTDAGKVNKFIAESGVSDKALEYGTKRFCNGSGNTWDAWIFVVGNAIKSEKLGEI